MIEPQIIKALEKAVKEDQGELAAWSQNYLREGNIRRYLFDMELLSAHYKTGKILDIGAAPYHLTYILSRKDYDVLALDIDPNRHASFISDNQLKVVRCNIELDPLPFEEGTFHYIIFNEIFEHLRINPIHTLREIHRVLHPEGTLALSTPNLYSIHNVIRFLLGRGFDNPYEEFEKLETIRHMGHVREYAVRQVREFLVKTGFDPVDVRRKSFARWGGLWIPFHYLQMLIPGFRDLQYHICKKA